MSVYKHPEAILQELGIQTPSDIDIEAIAYCLGAQIKYQPLDRCAARIVGRGDQAIITVDSRTGRQRQRFSIGHEIGHWMRDRGRPGMLCKPRDFTKWGYEARMNREALANNYASRLLLPKSMFTESARNKPMTFDTVEKLREEYGTSRTATAIRLVDLGSFPAMLVCHSKEKRLWYSKGPDLPEFLHPHRELRYETKAFELLHDPERVMRPTPMDADAWINLPNATGYSVYEHSALTYDNNVLSLIWWKDEAQIVDLVSTSY